MKPRGGNSGSCVTMTSLLSLPPDVLSYVILPMLLCDWQRLLIQLILAGLHVPLVYPEIGKELLDILNNLKEMAQVHPHLKTDVERWCTFHLEDAIACVSQAHKDFCSFYEKYNNAFERVRNELLSTRARIAPHYVNDGCLNCGKFLPYYWPILNLQIWKNPNMKKERSLNIPLKMRNFYKNTNKCVQTGCCSLTCYAEYYSDIYRDPAHPANTVAGYLCKLCLVPLVPSGIIGFNVKENDTCYCSKCRGDLYEPTFIHGLKR
jgi:hypothetical protein